MTKTKIRFKLRVPGEMLHGKNDEWLAEKEVEVDEPPARMKIHVTTSVAQFRQGAYVWEEDKSSAGPVYIAEGILSFATRSYLELLRSEGWTINDRARQEYSWPD